MITKFKLFENTNTKTIIVVDVQPGHQDFISFDIYDFTNYLNENKDKNILYLFNGTELGYEDEYELKQWLYEYGLDENTYINFHEKGYGFFRDLMDNSYVDNGDIVKIGKEMIKNDIYDYREFDDDIKEKYEEIYNIYSDDYLMYIPDDIVDFFKNNIYSNETSEIIGGGQGECLTEIELLLNIMDLKYVENFDFIY